MLYRPLWIALQFLYRLYFRHNHQYGFENWIGDKPVIFTSNHVNSFLDPIIFSTRIWKKVIYLARGDVFNTPFKKWLLWQMRIVPIFRKRDAQDSNKKNEETFDRCYNYLKEKESIMIFPEGDCVQEKHLRKLQKGTARMAFGAVQKHGWAMDLHVIPTTVNYSHPANFRTELMINVGKPLKLTDYKELYDQDPNRAMTILTRDLEEAMKKIYIHMESRDDLDLFEDIIVIPRNNLKNHLIPWRINSGRRFKMEKSVANKINQLRNDDFKKLESLKLKTKTYRNNLKELNLEDKVFGVNTPNLMLNFFLAPFLVSCVCLWKDHLVFSCKNRKQFCS